MKWCNSSRHWTLDANFTDGARTCNECKRKQAEHRRRRKAGIPAQPQIVPLDNQDAITRGRCIERMFNYLFVNKDLKVKRILPGLLHVANEIVKPKEPYAEPEHNVEGFHQ